MTEIEATPPGIYESCQPVQRFLDSTETALRLSDLAGFTFAASVLSSARDQLLALSRD
jgi:hypothetical protein